MRDVIGEFGLNAGNVWKAINSCGSLTEAELIEETGLGMEEFHIAVGWLARENKICKDGELFKLGETNLAAEIGENAGQLSKAIGTEEVDMVNISRLTQMEEKDTFSAVGWLAREGKINTNMEKRTDEIGSAKLEIESMRGELESLNADLETRNQIIKEMANQLTERQTQFVENVGIVERLQMELGQNQSKMEEMKVELNKRASDISQLQRELGNDFINPKITTSTLLNENSPLTSLQKQQRDVFELSEEVEGKKNLNWNEELENCDGLDTFHDGVEVPKTKTLDEDESE